MLSTGSVRDSNWAVVAITLGNLMICDFAVYLCIYYITNPQLKIHVRSIPRISPNFSLVSYPVGSISSLRAFTTSCPHIMSLFPDIAPLHLGSSSSLTVSLGS